MAGEETPRLIRLDPYQPARMATSSTLCWLQHKANLAEGYPVLTDLYETGKPRRFPIAVVGGGPSLDDTMQELRDFPGPVMACGSAHDHLVRSGIKLSYCAVLDPDPIAANYLREDGGECLYLVASHVAPHVFGAIARKRLAIFGAGGTFTTDDFHPLPVVMAGGRTVGTRAMGLALALGFTELHLFGIDSCVREDKTHAYAVEPIGDLKPIYCGGRKFMCAPYMIGQASDFQQFMGLFGHVCGVAVHGDGLIAQIVKVAEQQAA